MDSLLKLFKTPFVHTPRLIFTGTLLFLCVSFLYPTQICNLFRFINKHDELLRLVCYQVPTLARKVRRVVVDARRRASLVIPHSGDSWRVKRVRSRDPWDLCSFTWPSSLPSPLPPLESLPSRRPVVDPPCDPWLSLNLLAEAYGDVSATLPTFGTFAKRSAWRSLAANPSQQVVSKTAWVQPHAAPPDDLPLVNMLKDLSSHIDVLAAIIGAPPKWGVVVALFIDSVLTARDLRQFSNAVLSFASHFSGFSDLLSVAWNSLCDALSSIPMAQSSDAPSPIALITSYFKSCGFDEMATKIWSKLVNACGLAALTALFGGVLDCCVPLSISEKLKSLPIGVGDFPQLGVCIFGLIDEVLKAGMSFFSGKPHVWFKGNTLVQYMTRGDDLIASQATRSDLVYDPIRGGIVAANYLEDLKKLVGDGQLLLAIYSDSSRSPSLQARQLTLKKLIATVSALVQNLEQVPAAFAVAMHGPPKLGKTVFAGIILDELAHSYRMFPPGVKKSAMSLTWCPPNAKHADGFGNRKLVLIDDMAMKGPKHEDTIAQVDLVMKMVNNVVTPLPMADVDEKGKFGSNVNGLVITSNDPQFGFNCIPNPGAPIRRINMFVTLEVKECYRLNGNAHALDTSRLTGGANLCVWNITVTTPLELDTHPYFSINGPVIFKTDNTAAFVLFLRSRIEAHQAAQGRVLQLLVRDAGDKCCSCNVRWVAHAAPCSSTCDYPMPEPQGGFFSTPAPQDSDSDDEFLSDTPSPPTLRGESSTPISDSCDVETLSGSSGSTNPFDLPLPPTHPPFFSSRPLPSDHLNPFDAEFPTNRRGAPWSFYTLTSELRVPGYFQVLSDVQRDIVSYPIVSHVVAWWKMSENVSRLMLSREFPPPKMPREYSTPSFAPALLNAGPWEAIKAFYSYEYWSIPRGLWAYYGGLIFVGNYFSLPILMAYYTLSNLAWGYTTENSSGVITFKDFRHAAIAVVYACDWVETIFLLPLLWTFNPYCYEDVLTYLWMRPRAKRLRTVNLIAVAAACGIVGVSLRMLYNYFSSSPKVTPQGAAHSVAAWEPTPDQPWMNAVTHYHDPAPNALTQVPASTARGMIESRLAAISFPDGTWCNLFCVDADFFLMATHTVPKQFPCVVNLYYHSRRGHRKEPTPFTILAEHILHIGGENSIVRIPGVRLSPSCVSLFRTKNNVTFNFDVAMVARGLMSDPSPIDLRDYQVFAGRFVHHGETHLVNGCRAAGSAKSGMCGAPVYSLAPRTTILGIHYAGDSLGTFSYSTTLTAEALAEGLTELRARQTLVPSAPVIPQGFFLSLVDDPKTCSFAPHPKSLFRDSKYQVEFLGVERAGSAHPTSDFARTALHDVFALKRAELGLEMSAPLMSPRQEGSNWLDPSASFLSGLRLERGVHLSEFKQTLDDVCSLVSWGEVVPRGTLSPYEVLNGTPGRGGLTPLNLETSAGGHWGCKKSSLFDKSPLGVITFKQPVRDAMDAMIARVTAGMMPNNFFSCSFKDEAVSLAKAQAGETRVIQVPEVSFTLAVRKYLSVPLMLATGAMREVAIGMNCYGDDGTRWVEQMHSASGRFTDVDIKKLDRSYGAFDFLFCIAFTKRAMEAMSYTKDEIAAGVVLAYGIYKPIFRLRGSYFVAESLNASGHPLTAIWNSLVCLSLYVRWYRRNKMSFSPLVFRSDMCLSVYGDDGAMRRPEAWSYQSIVESFLLDGYIATPGEKNRITGDVSDISELSFLKRYPRFHDELERFVMALSKKSILKMLSYKITSKYISAFDQEVTTARNALWEAYLWGPEYYQSLLVCLPQRYIDNMVLPTKERVLRRFETGCIDPVEFRDVLADVVPHFSSVAEALPGRSPHPRPVVSIFVTPVLTSMFTESAMRATASRRPRPPPLFRGAPWKAQRTLEPSFTSVTAEAFKQPLASQLSSSGTSVPTSDSATSSGLVSQPFEGTMGTAVSASSSVVQFVDATETRTDLQPSGFVADPALLVSSPELGRFLERPVAITTIDWTTGTGFNRFDPMDLWYNLPPIKARLLNYLGIRGTFHLRFVINGTQLHYGRLLVAYEPYSQYFSLKPMGGPINTITLSQLKHALLDPACNESVEFAIPYHGINEFYALSNAATPPGGYLGQIATLHYVPLATLAQIAAAVDPVTVKVYCWWSDVSLLGTAEVAQVEPHSGHLGSHSAAANGPGSRPSRVGAPAKGALMAETKPGFVSQIATTVSKASSALADVLPSMRPFFLASEAAASGVAMFATALGFSLPPNVTPPMLARVRNSNVLANAIGMDTSAVLALDPHAQVSPDSRIVHGEANDDMLITAIAGRPSVIAVSNWSSSSDPAGILYSVNVTPAVYVFSTPWQYHIPCGHMASMFAFWRGSMVYDIDVVASKFHSGRLLVYWDPSASPATNRTATNMLTNYSTIIDLATQRKVRVVVPYFGPQGFKQCRMAPSSGGHTQYECNGTLVIAVETALTSPNPVDIVQVIVSASAGPDIEFMTPTSKFFNTQSVKPALTQFTGFPPSLMAGQEELVDEVIPQMGDRMTDLCGSTEVSLGPKTVASSSVPVYSGERVVSIRELVKRPQLIKLGATPILSYSVSDHTGAIAYVFPQFPFPGGFDATQPLAASVPWTFLTWSAQSFMALRGGSRYKMFMSSPTCDKYIPIVSTRSNKLYTGPTAYGMCNPITNTDFVAAYNALAPYFDSSRGLNESGYYQMHEVELPFQSITKWLPAPFPSSLLGYSPTFGASTLHQFGLAVLAGPIHQTDETQYMLSQIYHSAADDISLSWYVSAPVVTAI